MQFARFSIALAAAVTATPLLAAAPATPSVQIAPAQAAPANPEAGKWLERMGDFTQNASAFKDPKAFNQWFTAMTDPSMMATGLPVMMEPGSWIRTTSSMMQPGAVTNYMAFANPGLYGGWMGAMMDPNFYMQNMGGMADPSKMMRWAMLPMDPRMMQAGMGMMNPNSYMKWMMAPADPRVWGLMFAPANPQLYGSMAGAMMPQGMVGSGNWQTFMYPKHPVVNLSPAAPVTIPINVMDPSTWGNMMGMFSGFMPSGGPLGGGMQMPGMPFFGSGASGIQMPGMPFFGGGANPYLQPGQAPQAAAFQSGVATKFSLAGDALFKFGKATIGDLTTEGKGKLDELAAKIKATGAIDTLRVIGHADKMGKAAANMKLSQTRAAAVASYLKAQGVKAGKIITAGKGDTQPLVQCDAKLAKDELKACLQPNRRVEVEITPAK